ncbi:Pentatricopeptide repeat-containing protein [Acorus calamus]|uniref:Pentatricopeptide repeat-containing protein n=1 Tax=Acorus calamus TaxID=4465 RepID=A0AAV9BYR2_ACOCL|nr:Pentatricopeptide repeat-containing protein [Acorus calamus]
MNPTNLQSTARNLSRALLSISSHWDPSHEQILHSFLSNQTTPLSPPLIASLIDPHLIRHHRLSLGLFNWASRQPNFTHTQTSYASLFKSLSFSRHPKPLKSLLRRARAENVRLGPSLYAPIISTFLACGGTSDAASMFDEMCERGFSVELDPKLCNSVLAALGGDGFLESAKRVFERLVFYGTQLSEIGFGVFVSRYSRVAELDETLGLVEVAKRVTPGINGSIIAFLVISGLCRAERFDEAWRALEELRMRECKPDFIAYRVVAEAFKSKAQLEEAHRVLKQKRKRGVAPRMGDYKAFVLGLVLEGRIQEVSELGEAIMDGDFPIDDELMNVLIESVSSVYPESAVSFCKNMMKKERFPTMLALSKMSSNLCKHGKTEDMCDLFRLLSSKGYFSGFERYNLMISLLCKAGRVREGYSMIKEMRKNGFCPSVVTYNSLMEALCREDLLRPAKRLWDEMFANGCSGNLETYNTLIQKLSETGEAEEAQRLFHHMLQNKIVPDKSIYDALIKGLCREAKTNDALDVFNDCVRQEFGLALSILNMLILSLCEAGDFKAASKTLCDLPPDVENSASHVILLKSLVDAADVNTAINHVDWIRENSDWKFEAISTQLIASLSTCPDPEPLIQLLRVMHEKGVVSDAGLWRDLFDGPLAVC